MVKKDLLEEINRKKKVLDFARPLPPVIVAKLKEYFDVEWTYNSNAIEGNTLTLQETKVILEIGVTIGGKTLREHLEVTNHKEAIDFVEKIAEKKTIVTEEDILNLHRIILKEIDSKNAGKYRNIQVRISGSNYLPPEAVEVPVKMKELVRAIEVQELKGEHPIEIASHTHFNLVHIHPFVDGNGRTARLLMNLILIKFGYPPAVIQNKDRMEYYKFLEKAHEGNIESFDEFISKSVERSLNIYLEAISP